MQAIILMGGARRGNGMWVTFPAAAETECRCPRWCRISSLLLCPSPCLGRLANYYSIMVKAGEESQYKKDIETVRAGVGVAGHGKRREHGERQQTVHQAWVRNLDVQAGSVLGRCPFTRQVWKVPPVTWGPWPRARLAGCATNTSR